MKIYLFLYFPEVKISFTAVVGKCYLTFSENLDCSIEEWSEKGPHRFYFTVMYNSETEEFEDPPSKACNIGKFVNKSDKIKSKSKKAESAEAKMLRPPEYPIITKKLRTLDVFAGCGGLSEGLHQAGVAETHWAIEIDEAAAHAYRINNPKAAVFTGDCNALLKKTMNVSWININNYFILIFY